MWWQSHSRLCLLPASTFQNQPYLRSCMFSNEEVSDLSSLRSHTLRTIRCNFKKLYQNNLNCPLNCWPDGSIPIQDTQEHLLLCSRLSLSQSQTLVKEGMKYDDIYDSFAKKKVIASYVYIELRNKLITEDKQLTSGQSSTLDPTT